MGRHANIAIFVPHLGCPRQCSFCQQRTITGQQDAPGPQDVLAAAETAAGSLSDCSGAEIAFFGGSFTAIDRGYMLSLLEAAKRAVERYGFKGVRCSTRPDAIDSEVLDILQAHRVTAVELGAQSMDDGVLLVNRRGHTAEDTRKAAGLIRRAGLELGLQMMTGLYTSTEEKDLETAREFLKLLPATVRVYPTIVLPGTELCRLYEAGEYRPQELGEAVELCAELLEMFEGAGVRVIRMGLHPGEELERRRVAGPYHQAFRQLVESRLFLDKLRAQLKEPGEYRVRVNPRDISTALGQGRENPRRLSELGYSVTFIQDETVKRGGFAPVDQQGEK
ncbi:elongator complex protein 3 [Acutalibacter muris]|uniref:elongator complex protein 3 n=1 Tax=Acutalibacter muris TaxID=1796620 RepID=UPI0025B78F1A|nr:radical SAM protein [Acutalibacter muris]